MFALLSRWPTPPGVAAIAPVCTALLGTMALLTSAVAGADSGAIAHPFLVVKPAEIAGLRARANQLPYSAMKTAARNSAAKTLPAEATTDANIRSRALLMNEIMSSAALSYLLEADTTARRVFRDKIISQIVYWDPARSGSLSAHYLLADPPMQSWDYMTPTSTAFFQTVLALDIIYNDITPAQRSQFEGWLAVPGNFYTQREINWVTAGLGARGIWAMYTDNAAVAQAAKTQYITDTETMMSPDGPFVEGTGYAIARWFNPDREQKSSFGDILRYTGAIADNQWYGNPRLRKFQEWLNGYAFAPSRDSWGMGDGGIQRFASWMMNAHRSGRFSAAAGAYERWLKQGFNPGGRLTAYVFTDPPQPGSTAQSATGRIFPSGGAYFRQQPGMDTNDLAGVLLNVKYEGDYRGHMHKETNALYLAGYGAILMGGSGYNNWAQSYGGYTWEYINRRAVSGNVALIDYDITRNGGTTFLPSAVNDHRDTEIDRGTSSYFGGDGKFGGGVSGLVTGVVDIASGTTAGTRNGGVALDALPNGNHLRHFFFVQPQDGKGGYFAAIDTLNASAATPLTSPLAGHTVWHPNGNLLTTAAAATEYQWRIDNHDDVNLAIYLATPPATTRVYDGALADRLIGKYLFNSYVADASRRVQAATLFYPYTNSAAHPKATFTRLSASTFSGASVAAGNGVIDYLVESRANAVFTPQADVTARGTGVLYRRINSTLAFYAGVSARQFRLGTRGFVSDKDITVVARERSGRLSIPTGGAALSLYYPAVTGVRIDGNVASSAVVGNGKIDVTIAAGQHRFELLTADTLFATDFEP